MNPYEKACKEFLKGCSNAETNYPEECQDCLDAFIEHIKWLKWKEEKKEDNK